MNDEFAKRCTEHQSHGLELLAAAFLSEFGLKPSEAVLVQKMTPTGMEFYFKKREEQ